MFDALKNVAYLRHWMTKDVSDDKREIISTDTTKAWIYRYSSWNQILYNIFGLHNLYILIERGKIRIFLLTSDRGEHWLLKIIFILKFDLLNVTENKLWFQPECTGNGPDGQVGPSPRAFHIAIAIDCHMFVFGGRSGNKRSFSPYM